MGTPNTSNSATPDQTGWQNPFGDATDAPATKSATPAQTGWQNPFGDTSEASAPAAAPSLASRVGSTAADVGVGFGKGALDTVNTVSGLLNKIPGVGETLAPSAGIKASENTAQSTNTAQSVGKGAEGIAEFFLGDEALKGLSLAKRLGLAQKVAGLAEESPTVAKLINAGLNALRTGTVTGGETAAKGGSPTESLEAGAAGAAGGAALEGAGAGIKKGYQYVKELYKPLVDAGAGTIDTAKGLIDVNKGVVDPKTVQPTIQKGIKEVVSDAAKDSGVKPSQSTSIRDAVADMAEGVRAKSQPIFQKFDELSGGLFSDAQARAAKYRGALDKAGKDAYDDAKADQDTLFEKYKDQIAPGALNQARADWRQYRALQDVDDALNRSVSGQRPDIAAKAGVKQPGETLNPKTLMNNLNKLYREGTLQTALGEDHAAGLLQRAGTAQQALEDIAYNNRQTVAANRAQNTATKAANERFNQGVRDTNAAQNAQKTRGRAYIAGAGATALAAGASAAMSGTVQKAVKSALSGQ
jgi:hypothetical protein